MKRERPALVFARLQERVRKDGRRYLTGRFGLVKIFIVKSDEIESDGAPIWNLVVQEAPSDNEDRGAEIPLLEAPGRRN